MVRDLRIKSIKFTPANLTSDGDGNIDVYSATPINGTVHKVQWEGGNSTATGSLYISVSGVVPEFIIDTFRSGLVAHSHVGSSWTKYPIAPSVEKVLGSAIAITDGGNQVVVNSLIRVQGSGLGDGKSGLGFTVFYI